MTNNQTTELLPCPFCGELPEIVFKEAPSNIIKCSNYYCPVHQPSTVNCRTWEECVSRWNTRANSQTELEKLNQELVECLIASKVYEQHFMGDKDGKSKRAAIRGFIRKRDKLLQSHANLKKGE